jgi:hypothetical protein
MGWLSLYIIHCLRLCGFVSWEQFADGRHESDSSKIQHLRALANQYTVMTKSVNELKLLRGLDTGEKLDPRDKIRATARRVGLSVPRVRSYNLPVKVSKMSAYRRLRVLYHSSLMMSLRNHCRVKRRIRPIAMTRSVVYTGRICSVGCIADVYALYTKQLSVYCSILFRNCFIWGTVHLVYLPRASTTGFIWGTVNLPRASAIRSISHRALRYNR